MSSIRQKTLVVAILAMTSAASQSLDANRTIASFENPTTLNDWGVVNDSVMGGVSTSGFRQTENGTLLFQGRLSLENNGGFVSLRNRPQNLGLDDVAGFVVRARGDGRSYYLDLRESRQMTAGSFRARFATTEGEWTETYIPASEFVRQSFGRPYPNTPLRPQNISSIGFTLSDKNPGPFHLEIDYVKTVARGDTNDSFSTVSEVERELDSTPEAIINLAISRGVPLFNSGNPEACAAIYEIACLALLERNALSQSTKTRISQSLMDASQAQSFTRQAWILRYALDDALRELEEIL
jgi:NADH dehydrogenase [ubiquinone] 1 alpha subcomplex assembly factor 1